MIHFRDNVIRVTTMVRRVHISTNASVCAKAAFIREHKQTTEKHSIKHSPICKTPFNRAPTTKYYNKQNEHINKNNKEYYLMKI